MKNSAIAIISICILCGMFLTACRDDGVKPDYLLEGARDNGFVPAYRAYFAIKDNKVTEISKAKYENYIYKDDDHYKIVTKSYYLFEVNAETNDPSDWEYEQNKNNDEMYDTEILKNQLLDMNVNFEGNVDIQITEFDEYILIEVANMNDANTVINSKYAVFHDGEILSMPDDIDLSSIRDIHKYKTGK